MQINVEALSKVKKKISFEIPADRVTAEIEKAYDQIRKQVAIKGFRKGKVPQAMLEKHYSDRMADDVLKNLVNDTYFSTLKEHKIYPVSHPVIDSDELKKGQAFTYSATVEVFPEIEVKDYAGLAVKKEKYVRDEAVIEKRLGEMREGMAQLEPVEGRPAAQGDFVTIDFKGFLNGVPFAGGEATDHVLELGSGRFIPGFEEQLMGMEVAAEKDIVVTFPAEYGSEELAGKEVTFTVKLKEIKVKELPPLDDEFAKQFGEFETLADLKAKLTEMHDLREKDRIDADLRDRVVKALIEKNDIEVPETMVERQLDMMLESTKRRLANQKLSLAIMGLDDESYKVQFKSVAEQQVKGSLLLDALSGQEKITVGEADVEARLKKIAEENGQPFERINAYYKQNQQALDGLVSQVKEDRVVEFLLDKATVTEVDKGEI
ncbi:trigger factor [Geomobilimonas luticola]|uniref:Trigger factor n=1 Tax=Geomobilimonas luticola TaxID=1114878 RepID=A0ABS5SGE0_9BACT|nr:trigger factor [Geomobilimonas luticola]MBT0654427.1 trigger factor [Geomobilimonas luticola]